MNVTELPKAEFIEATTIDIASDVIDGTFRVTVVPPFGYDGMQTNFATLYLLDGAICLPMASSIALSTQINAFGFAPPVICVGISYATDNVLDIMSLRTRDMTPTEAELPPSPIKMDTFGVGGAPKFLDVLTNEIIPTVEGRWRVDAEKRCLVGWSLGGLFGLYTLFNRPESFSRYLLVSPSIWWDDRTIMRDEASYAAANEDLPAKVFMCVGEREETAPSRMWPPVPDELATTLMSAQMVSSMQELAATLRSRRYPSFDLTSQVFQDEHHVTVFPAAFARGLLSLAL